MKLKINVIDLDGTLIPYDSFRKYVYHFLFNRSAVIPIAILILLRVTRSIGLCTFKKHVMGISRKVPFYSQNLVEFSDHVLRELDQNILLQIKRHTDDKTINVLCSASPEDYVSLIASKLNWQFIASKLDQQSSEFLHMHGANKLSAIQKKYPAGVYVYNFAISDSESDAGLIDKFQYKILKK